MKIQKTTNVQTSLKSLTSETVDSAEMRPSRNEFGKDLRLNANQHIH